MSKPATNRPPVLILDGQANALSVVRSLGRQGVDVYLSAPKGCYALNSRYCRKRFIAPAGNAIHAYWRELLLEQRPAELDGAILLPCSDIALEFVIAHQPALEDHFILEGQSVESRQELLDKERTLELARAAGVPFPEFWEIKTAQDVANISDQVNYPAIIKPTQSHLFQAKFDSKKYFLANDRQELLEQAQRVLDADLEFMVSEYIPGPDDLLCSYFTYHDQNQQPLFHFTKRVLRRYPVNHGGATYHVTAWQPDVAEMGKKLLKAINFTGLCNMEFKRDSRDGQLKLIEINARFVASQELVYQSGMDIAKIVYCHLSGQQPPKIEQYRQQLHLWIPDRDLRAFLQLKRRGELSLGGWLSSLAHPQVVNYLKLHDPWPGVVKLGDDLGHFGSQLLRKLGLGAKG